MCTPFGSGEQYWLMRLHQILQRSLIREQPDKDKCCIRGRAIKDDEVIKIGEEIYCATCYERKYGA